MGQTGRTAALALALFALVTLAGCGSSGTSAPSSGATVSASPATQWAGAVCSSVQSLEQSLKNLTGEITTNENGSKSNLSQVKQQLLKRVGEVQSAASSLATTVQNPSASADQQLKTAQQQLKTASDQSQQALQQVKSAATQLQSASTSAAFTKSAVALGTAALGAATDVGSVLSSLKQYASSAHASVKNAFGNAPACQDLSNNE